MKLSVLPCRFLRPYIDRYWLWEGEYVLPAKLLPGTGQELVVHYGSPIRHVTKTGTAALPLGYAVSAREKFQAISSTGVVGFLAVRFRSGAFRYFCRQSMADLTDEIVDIDAIWGKRGRELTERVNLASSIRERVGVIEKFMLEFFLQYAQRDGWLDRIINQIYYQAAVLRLSEHYGEWGISDRQLQRQFNEAVGIGPKRFQKAARFQAVVKSCLLEKRRDYLPVALDNGYYDQAHFIKDCRQFIGESPADFFQDKNFMSHFYNRSVQACTKMM